MLQKMMRNFIYPFLFSFILLSVFTFSNIYAEDNIKYFCKCVTVESNKVTLNMLEIPDNDLYEFKVVNSNPVGSVSELKTLVNTNSGIAGINGTFFEAYNSDSSQRYPDGLLINNSKVISGGSNVSFFSDGKKKIGNFTIKITGGINGSYKWPNNWNAWSINHVFGTQYQSVILNSSFGNIPNDGSTNIVVNNDVVENITTKPVSIPKNGYVIHIGSKENTRSRFKVGDKVSYTVEFLVDGKSIAPGSVSFALGAGPKLLTSGKYDVNYSRDGFSAEKITALRSSRSFVGLKKDGTVVLGTTPLASIPQLAKALKSVGITDAMNLDGGASSGLYSNQKYITKPGRLISNALVVVKKNYETASIIINGVDTKEIGIIKDGNTLVPLRGILEKLGIQIVWNKQSQSVTCLKGEQNLKLYPNKNNTQDGFILNSKSYVPLKYISEKFGYKVTWDSKKHQVLISDNQLSQP